MLRSAAAKRSYRRLPALLLFRHNLAAFRRDRAENEAGVSECLHKPPGTMQSNDLQKLAESLLPVALAAARLQLAHRAAGVTATRKADGSPVTIADQESEALILAALTRIAPGVPVVSEEAAAAGKSPSVGTRFFLVDPLDGTKPYLRGEPHFTVNIALIEDRVPVFGLVYAPALGDFWVTTGLGQAGAARLAPSSDATELAACG